MREQERRFTLGAVEIRSAGQGGELPRIGGYAAKFGVFSDNLGGFVERVSPSAFNKSAGDGFPGVIARYNHDDNFVLGTADAGTLRLGIDGTGLHYDVQPPSSRVDVVELVGRGDVRQSSFAFMAYGDSWERSSDRHDGLPVRDLVTMRLMDVAPVNTPAYPDATAGLRSLARHVDASYEEVRKAAEAGELLRFFGKPAPVVVDMAPAKESRLTKLRRDLESRRFVD